MIIRRFLLIGIALLLPLLAPGQTARLYTPEDGLINSQINRFAQDGRGYIWICSEGGLTRFDGMSFETFQHDRENAQSLPSDSVHDFLEDSHGTKWVGTATGLAIFESDYNRFLPFDLQDARDGYSNLFVGQILEVPDRGQGSKLFICTGGNGIYVIDPESRSLLSDKREQINRHLPSEYINWMYADAARHLWIIPEGNLAMVVLNVDTLEPENDIIWDEDLQAERLRIRPTAIAEDPDTHDLLIGTSSHGILHYEAAGKYLHRARGARAATAVISSAIFNTLSSGRDNRTYLLGNENGGLAEIDLYNGTYRPARLPSLRRSAENWKATKMFQDKQGNLWLGLYQTGVLVAPRSMFGFSYLGFNSRGTPESNSACIMSIYESGNRLWVGTDGAGLFCQDGTRTTRNYTRENSALTNNSVMAVTGDRHGTIWIGTYLDGLFYLDPQGGIHKFTGNIGAERIRSLAYDAARDCLYVGTYGAGLVLVDTGTKTVTGRQVQEDNLWISALHIADDGQLWVGTYNGPKCYDPTSGQLSPIKILQEGPPLRIYAICSLPDGTRWFGTGDGVFCVASDGKLVRQYTEKDGLANNIIRDILGTPSGEIWCSTAAGLSRISPKTQVVTSYHASDGLQGNEFRSGAAFSSPSGRLYFGGTSGVTAFSPLLVDSDTHKVPQVSLSKLTQMDREIVFDPTPGHVNLIDKHISEATRIKIPNTVNLFSVEFSVPEYTNPQRIVYAYRLRGFDTDWKTVPGYRHAATYTNVPPGHYQLDVKAYFEGIPDDYSEHAVQVRVVPPWYRTGAAYVFYLLLFAFFGYLLWKGKQERSKRAAEKQDAELKELRLGLFTNLTHEIRTPLTLVMGPLRTMRESEADPARKDTYNLMYRNCLRINRLVDQLMDLRKIDAGQMPMHFRQTDLIYFIRDIMQSFQNLARSKNIRFSLLPAQEELLLWIDQGNFDKIIYNILSNAFKHTPDGGIIRLSVSAPQPNQGALGPDIREYIEVDIFNSGSRIEEAYISRIFDRFVQVDPYDANIGSGVGLNLTKMLVGLHHGDISVENEADGVVFHVLVPVGKDHLTEQELSVTTHHKDLYVKGAAAEKHEDETFARKDAAEEKQIKTRKTLLIVEDDTETRDYLKTLLCSTYNIISFSNSQEAWPAVATKQPDAVLADLVMPGMRGTELCAKIRQNPATNHIPVIILTGQNGEREEQEASDSGADKFLAKPISVELLMSSIAQVVAARDTLRGKYARGLEYDYSTVQMGSADEKLMRRIVESIQAHLDDPEYDVSVLCREVGISRVHLNRKLKENGNVPPSVLIKTFRMKQAAYLLVKNKVNVSEVAYRVGFASHSYFSSSFREYFGMSPRDFVSRYQQNPDDEDLKKLFE